ncbi:MAG: heme ABC exporter ATP-binding protein CcmA [Devosia sp.]
MSPSQAAPKPELVLSGLCLSRGERQLFSELSFAVSAGEVLFIRGPNGAGKSSLLLALAGILRPDAGTIAWRDGGSGTERGEATHFLGHLPAVKPRLTLVENLSFWAALYGGGGLAPETALEEVGLAGLGALEAGHLSAGQTRRLALARLLIAERPIWLLDEPTAALDAEGEKLVGRLIAAHCAAPKPGLVMAATHQDIPLPGASRSIMLGATP